VNVLSEHRQKEIEILLKSGRYSRREIARILGINRETVGRYARELGGTTECDGQNQPRVSTGKAPEENQNQPGVSTGWATEENQNQPVVSTGKATVENQIQPRVSTCKATEECQNQPEVSTGSAALMRKPSSSMTMESACEEYREWIEGQVREGRNAVAIYQDLVDTMGFKFKYSSVRRFVRSLKKKAPEIFDVLEFAPGEEAQVDYGSGAPTRHPETGKMRRPRLFVMTLRYSRKAFRKVVWQSGSEVWARLHEEAFRYFGGSTAYVVLDNLKEGVIKPDIADPEINRLYSEVLAHYNSIADPCRVRDPNRKGTVECAIRHTQDTALKGKQFDSIEEQNEYLMYWEERWAAPRIHGTTKRQVTAMFEEEKPFLQQLPAQGFRFFKEETRTVDDAATVIADKVRYSARPALPFTKVAIRLYENEIEIRDATTYELLRRHVRSSRPGALVMEEADRIFNPSRNTKYGLRLAAEIGPHTLRVCEYIFASEGRVAHKSIFAIARLGSKHRHAVVEEAARLCVERELFSYSQLKKRLNNLLVGEQFSKQIGKSPELVQQSKLIRPASEYAKFFKNFTTAQETPHDDELY
jgi:transposase